MRGKKLSIEPKDLPKPVLDVSKRSPIQVDPNHGLWGFFNKERTALADTLDDAAHGRGWTVEELSRKDWEDLHAIWWKCLKERNRLATERVERERIKPGYGGFESSERGKAVSTTMSAIKKTLLARWYAWEDARELARQDPEIEHDENGGMQYRPQLDDTYDPEQYTDSSDELVAKEENGTEVEQSDRTLSEAEQGEVKHSTGGPGRSRDFMEEGKAFPDIDSVPDMDHPPREEKRA